MAGAPPAHSFSCRPPFAFYSISAPNSAQAHTRGYSLSRRGGYRSAPQDGPQATSLSLQVTQKNGTAQPALSTRCSACYYSAPPQPIAVCRLRSHHTACDTPSLGRPAPSGGPLHICKKPRAAHACTSRWRQTRQLANAKWSQQRMRPPPPRPAALPAAPCACKQRAGAGAAGGRRLWRSICGEALVCVRFVCACVHPTRPAALGVARCKTSAFTAVQGLGQTGGGRDAGARARALATAHNACKKG